MKQTRSLSEFSWSFEFTLLYPNIFSQLNLRCTNAERDKITHITDWGYFWTYFFYCRKGILLQEIRLLFFNLFSIFFIRVTNGLDQDQARCSVGLIWVQTVCKGLQQTTKQTYMALHGSIKFFQRGSNTDNVFLWRERWSKHHYRGGGIIGPPAKRH